MLSEFVPIWIPSRGRAGNAATTIRRMIREGLEPNVLVPQDEHDAYYAAFGDSIKIWPTQVKGIGLKRQWILRLMRTSGIRRFWMIDDDISNIAHRDLPGAPFIQTTWSASLSGMEQALPFMSAHGLAGPAPRQYAYTKMVQSEDDQRIGFVVLVRTDGPWNYWPFLHEDTDLNIQVLTSGWHTRLFYEWGFNTAINGTLPGGCSDDYARGAGELAAQALYDKWEPSNPGLVRIEKSKQGNAVARVDWSMLRATP